MRSMEKMQQRIAERRASGQRTPTYQEMESMQGRALTKAAHEAFEASDGSQDAAAWIIATATLALAHFAAAKSL